MGLCHSHEHTPLTEWAATKIQATWRGTRARMYMVNDWPPGPYLRQRAARLMRAYGRYVMTAKV